MSSSARCHPGRPEAEREQIFEALVAVCLERGYHATTVSIVLSRAGLGHEAFARHFSDLEDCFTAYLLEAREAFFAATGAALPGITEWREQIRAVAHAMLRFWRADESRARMVLVETLAAGPRAQLVRDQGMELMFDLIDRGRAQMENPETLTRATAEAVGGAVFSQMHMALERGDLSKGEDLLRQLMYNVVLPYMGTEAALEELSRRPPVAEGR